MNRSATLGIVASIALSGAAMADECGAVWRKLDAENIEKQKENPSLIVSPGFELRSNETMPRFSEVPIYLQAPNAPQTKIFMDTFNQVASIADLKVTLAVAPIIATIGVGVIDESGLPTEEFHEVLEAFITDAEARAELVASMISDVTMRYSETSSTYLTSGEVRAPARRFIAMGTTEPSSIRTLAAFSAVGSRYLTYARECESYRGVFLFNSGFDELQPDDVRLLAHIYALPDEASSAIDR